MPDEDVDEGGANIADMEADGGEAEVAEPEPVEAEEREAMRRLQEEIGRLSVADHVVLMMHSLSALAVDRLGLAPETSQHQDLEQARLAIDSFKALLSVVEGGRSAEEVAAHRAALSQLQMAYVAALSGGDSSRTGEAS